MGPMFGRCNAVPIFSATGLRLVLVMGRSPFAFSSREKKRHPIDAASSELVEHTEVLMTFPFSTSAQSHSEH
jgi:hypothetical protein